MRHRVTWDGEQRPPGNNRDDAFLPDELDAQVSALDVLNEFREGERRSADAVPGRGNVSSSRKRDSSRRSRSSKRKEGGNDRKADKAAAINEELEMKAAALLERRIQVFLVDRKMPRMMGDDFVRNIRSLERERESLRSIIIGVSGAFDDDNIDKFKNAGLVGALYDVFCLVLICCLCGAIALYCWVP